MESVKATSLHALALDWQASLMQAVEQVGDGSFEVREWRREEGGGGRMAVLRSPWVEKAGVNVSLVHGPRNPLTGNPFVATGLSVIVHPRSPHAPTGHLNVRYFEETRDRAWYGGGFDLTPMGFPYDDDTRAFLAAAEEAVASAGFDPAPARARADEYFFVRHRGRPRGVGGIFVDDVAADERGRALVEAIVAGFERAYLPILRRRARQPWTDEEREIQLRARGVYVEFNLLYDKGTRFGFESGGNPDAILASLPPLASW